MTETWLPVVGYEGLYEVSDLGRVRSLDRVVRQRNRWGTEVDRAYPGRVLSPSADSSGYLQVTFSRDGIQYRPLVHHLVLAAFGPPRPEGYIADHADGDRRNNRVDNLRWATWSDNGRNRHDVRNKHGQIGVMHNPRSSTNPWIAMARRASDGEKEYLGCFPTQDEAAQAYARYRDTQFEWAR